MKLSISFAATVLGLAVGASATFPGFRGVTEGNNSCELTASTGEDTCSSRRFCQLPVGECRKRIAVFSGTCARAPSSCTYEWDPVCGCDGETYGNECEAYANSVSVQSYGECDSGRSRVGDSCSRSTDGADTCNGGLFCELPDGECRKRIDPHSGTCQKYPKSCTYNYDPVCGCDGKTYANKCEALANGVSVSSNDECSNNNRTPNSSKAPCQVGSKARMPCTDSKEYCQLEEGGCIYNTKNADGICIVKPSACTANFDPVCGCDYNTYDNECQAAAAGVSVRRKGSCERDEAEFLLA